MLEEYGTYESSFFIMTVPIDAELEIRNMSDEDFAVFFHEYIHFLQDITSFYGYMGIYDHGEYMRRAINDIKKMPKQFSVPISIEDNGDLVLLNKNIADFSLGDKGDLDFVVINDVSKDIFIEQFQLNDTFPIPELHVRAITNRGQEEIVVGAYAIRENMAYLLEKRCTTKYRHSNEYPYQIVDILANKMCPGKLTEEDLIALCDVSLQCSVPGYGLYQFLSAIGKGQIAIKKPEDLYDILLSKKTQFLGRDMTMPNALVEASKQAIDHLLSYVRIDKLSKDYEEWVNFTLGAGVGLRLKRPYFFIEMARGKRNKENAVLQFVAKNIGSPQMVNAQGMRFQLATERPICRFEYLEVVREIERLFEGEGKSCSLKSWCAMSPDGAPVDERCDKSPWTRSNDEMLCPYGLLWRHWNLADKEVVIK